MDIQQIKLWQKQALDQLQVSEGIESFETFHQQWLGKKSPLTQALKSLKELDPEIKKELGTVLHKARKDIESQYKSQLEAQQKAALDQRLQAERIDVSVHYPLAIGSEHPMSQVQRQVETIFTQMGYAVVDGPEIESEWFNFDALNIPGSHPARDMQDTFWVEKSTDNSNKNFVLRTQTSNMQIRSMLKNGAPLRVIAPGRVYRNEDVDMTHDAVFYQVEGLVVDKDISLADLKGMIQLMLDEIFGKPVKMRIRPGYFPFVEPGLEIDIWFEYTDKNGKSQARWLEFMGAGMVHPEVLKNSNVDPNEYQGFAFGFGLTRLVMMRYGIEDIRLLFSAKKDFLKQF